MDEEKVVHVAAVVADAEFLFHEVVELVEVKQRVYLAALVPDWDADVSGRAVYDGVRQGEAALVMKQLADILL